MANIIVIIDDDPDFANMAKRRLEKRLKGIEIEIYHQAILGFERLLDADKQSPALVFVDLGLPDVSGYQLVADIRQHEKTKEIAVVVCSARDGIARPRACRRSRGGRVCGKAASGTNP